MDNLEDFSNWQPPNHKEFIGKFIGIEKRAKDIDKILDDILLNQKPSKGSITENHEEYIAFVLSYSLNVSFGTMLRLAQEDNLIGSAILARSVFECYANIIWLEDNSTELTKTEKIKIIFDQAEATHKLINGEIESIKPLSKLGAGSITKRLESQASGWPILYSYLSSYTHMDCGYALHYGLSQDLGQRNVIVHFSTTVAINAINMLKDILPIENKSLKKIEKKLKKAEKSINKFVKYVNNHPVNKRTASRP